MPRDRPRFAVWPKTDSIYSSQTPYCRLHLRALPADLFKVVETFGLLAGSGRTSDPRPRRGRPPEALELAEEKLLFEKLEFDLFKPFDRAMMSSALEAEAVRSAGYPRADFLPQPFSLADFSPIGNRSFTYDLVFVGSENHANTRGIHWFYRHIYVPFLRGKQVSLAVAGRVCESLDFEDSLISKLGFVDDLENLYAASKLVVVPILRAPESPSRRTRRWLPERPWSVRLPAVVGSIPGRRRLHVST